MRLVTWNVNGLRACLGKGFLDFFQRVDADVVCLQETKLQPDQIALELPGYRLFWNSAENCYRCSHGHRFKSNGRIL